MRDRLSSIDVACRIDLLVHVTEGQRTTADEKNRVCQRWRGKSKRNQATVLELMLKEADCRTILLISAHDVDEFSVIYPTVGVSIGLSKQIVDFFVGQFVQTERL